MSQVAGPLTSVEQAQAFWTRSVLPRITEALQAGQRLRLTVKRETRSLEQNALLHALLTDISKRVEWAGAKRDAEVWKRLLTAAWLRARGEPIEYLPALDGCGIDLVFRRTSRLTVPELSELIEYIHAWMVDQGLDVTVIAD